MSRYRMHLCTVDLGVKSHKLIESPNELNQRPTVCLIGQM